MDRRIIRAASNALGYDVDTERVEDVMAFYADIPTKDLRRTLRRKSDAFEEAGGRGVELADEIDALRIALAARRFDRDAPSR